MTAKKNFLILMLISGATMIGQAHARDVKNSFDDLNEGSAQIKKVCGDIGGKINENGVVSCTVPGQLGLAPIQIIKPAAASSIQSSSGYVTEDPALLSELHLNSALQARETELRIKLNAARELVRSRAGHCHAEECAALIKNQDELQKEHAAVVKVYNDSQKRIAELKLNPAVAVVPDQKIIGAPNKINKEEKKSSSMCLTVDKYLYCDNGKFYEPVNEILQVDLKRMAKGIMDAGSPASAKSVVGPQDTAPAGNAVTQ